MSHPLGLLRTFLTNVLHLKAFLGLSFHIRSDQSERGGKNMKIDIPKQIISSFFFDNLFLGVFFLFFLGGGGGSCWLGWFFVWFFFGGGG